MTRPISSIAHRPHNADPTEPPASAPTGRAAGPAASAQPASPASPTRAAPTGDSFETNTAAPPARALRRGPFADSGPMYPVRENLQGTIRQLSARPMPPLRMAQLPPAPPMPQAVRAQENERAFREGGAATARAFLGLGAGAGVEATRLGTAGAAGFEAGWGAMNGAVGASRAPDAANAGWAVAWAAGVTTASIGLQHAAAGAHHVHGELGPVAAAGIAGFALTAEMTAEALESADRVRDAATRRGEWDRQRESTAREALQAHNEGYHDAMRADFTEDGVPGTINQERMQRDGDYAQAVIRTLEYRLAQRRY